MKLFVCLFVLLLVSIPSAFAQEEFDEEYVEFIMEHINSIEKLLVQADQEYSKGNKDLAMKLATIAYIEHYEYIEFELEQYNEKLIENVEWAMREELRGMIRDDAPASEISEKTEEILENLRKIAAIVPEFGVFTLMIFAVSILVTIIMLQKTSILKQCWK